MAEAFRIIKATDGWKGLRRGMLPRVLTVAPSTAISWMSYEFFSKWRDNLRHSARRSETVGFENNTLTSQRSSSSKEATCQRLDRLFEYAGRILIQKE